MSRTWEDYRPLVDAVARLRAFYNVQTVKPAASDPICWTAIADAYRYGVSPEVLEGWFVTFGQGNKLQVSRVELPLAMPVLDCCKYIPEQIRTVPLSYSRIFIVYLRDRRLVPKARTGVLADWGETCAQDIHC